MAYRVIFTPEATTQLIALYQYIANQGSPVTAERYTTAIADCCNDLCTFPHRGTSRDDLSPGLRITNYKKRAVIAYSVNETDKQVEIGDVKNPR